MIEIPEKPKLHYQINEDYYNLPRETFKDVIPGSYVFVYHNELRNIWYFMKKLDKDSGYEYDFQYVYFYNQNELPKNYYKA